MFRLSSLPSSLPLPPHLRLLSSSSSLLSQNITPPPPLFLNQPPSPSPPPPSPQPNVVNMGMGGGPSLGPSPFEATRFGDAVLTDDILHSLIGPAFEQFQEFRRDPANFDGAVVDQCANAMKTWALSKGATHYTHWFQPMSGVTAAKHNSFLQKKPYEGPIFQFSGKDLVKGETDGSSFPSGGIRSLLEARGYTIWDMNSPPFVRRHENCSTLVIPTAFVSWSGQALDVKTPLLRSEEAVNKEAMRLLKLLGDTDATRVDSFASAEQEFFLIDKNMYDMRPDLRITGRTLFSAPPPRGQDLEDHYYGKMPNRVLQCLHEAEQILWELGVPTKTRYSEVAPGQFELCPIYESSSLACDHNILVMEILAEVAKRHNLIMLSHEKPFAWINGSGKHINWSLSADGGKTSLFQSDEDHDIAINRRFWMFIISFIRAVHTHSELVRAAVVCPGNDYRLGQNEAPIDIISVYIGEVLDQACKQIMGQSFGSSELKNALNLGSLPPLSRDSIDRNRTGPIAFAHDKFEIRSVGSSQTCATVVTLLNTIMADALNKTVGELEERLGEGKSLEAATHDVMANTLKEHYNIVFNGNSNSDIWAEEAQLRGLPRHKTAPAALSVYNNPAKTQVFMRMGVLTEVERESRRNVTNTSFLRHITIELRTMLMILETEIIPAGFRLQEELSRSINQTADALQRVEGGGGGGEGGKEGGLLEPQVERLRRVGTIVSQLIEMADSHRSLLQEGETVAENKYVDPHSVFAEFHPRYTSALKEARVLVDELEILSNNWPFPRYSDMLLVV